MNKTSDLKSNNDAKKISLDILNTKKFKKRCERIVSKYANIPRDNTIALPFEINTNSSLQSQIETMKIIIEAIEILVNLSIDDFMYEVVILPAEQFKLLKNIYDEVHKQLEEDNNGKPVIRAQVLNCSHSKVVDMKHHKKVSFRRLLLDIFYKAISPIMMLFKYLDDKGLSKPINTARVLLGIGIIGLLLSLIFR